MGEFFRNNWIWIALIVFFFWMHSSGAGCGGHGGAHKHGGKDGQEPDDAAGHHH